MWKENLPKNCPPKCALGMDGEVFRVIKGFNPQEDDFVPFAILYPENTRYKDNCIAHATSFFKSYKGVMGGYRRAKGNLGNFVAKFQIKPHHGKVINSGHKDHLSVWFYRDWKLEDFKLLGVIEIEKD